MTYAIAFTKLAAKDLRGLAPPVRDRVMDKIDALRSDLSGDVKRLTDYTPEYRLRVGDWRVLFQPSATTIVIYRVLHRSKAYE